jgi:putative restriction endonuclease
MDRKGKDWSRDELIIAFNLYCRTPFGKINKSNGDIIRTANSIGRTPSSLGMKMCNFARFDPILRDRNVKGLEHGSKQDESIWKEFHEDWEGLAFESQRAITEFKGERSKEIVDEEVFLDSDVPTEAQKSVRVRLVQRFFRETVLSGYNFSCAICRLNLPMLLNASHIIPWSVDKIRRADPRNGLSLCVLHDRAFDRGLISVDDGFRIILSGEVKIAGAPKLHRVGLLEIEGKKIRLPDKFRPDQAAFTYHRENIFLQ